MWTNAETVLTTISMTTVSVSMRNSQLADSAPDWMKVSTGTLKASTSPSPTVMKAYHDSTAETTSRPDVTYSEALAPICEPKRPAIRKPTRGRKTIRWYSIIGPSALHHVHVFHRDRTAVAEEDDEDRQTDRGLGGGDR